MDKVAFNTTNDDLVSTWWATNKEGRIGDIRWLNNKAYRFVQNQSGVAFVAGRVYYGGAASAQDALNGIAYSFGQAAKSTGINLALGLAMNACPDQSYAWLQCYGENASAGVEGTAAVAITDSLKGVSGQTYLVKDVAAGVAPIAGTRTAIALAAQGAGGVVATRVMLLML